MKEQIQLSLTDDNLLPKGEPTVFQIGNEYMKRIPYGSESDGDRCPVCGVSRGRLHHLGCPEEECPKCGFLGTCSWCKPLEGDDIALDLNSNIWADTWTKNETIEQ